MEIPEELKRFEYLYPYMESKKLAEGDPSFYAFIMAAMRKADDGNLQKLAMVFPNVYQELCELYNLPVPNLP